ncbi:MAG: primosomal protein N' [Bacteroidales bacterium]|nr:primosomal protein N' [Bacteroidales bacterium]
MNGKRYIKVVVPLRLDWEPYYLLSDGVEASRGSRVKVVFAGRPYSAVVWETGCPEPPEPGKVRYINELEALPSISENELRLWKFIADYYLCTIGEVYKIACPLGLVRQDRSAKLAKLKESLHDKLSKAGSAREGTKKKAALLEAAEKLKAQISLLDDTLPWEPVQTKLSKAQAEALGALRRAFLDGKPALLDGVTGSGKTEIYITLASEALSQGRNVLILVPEIALSGQLEARLQAYFGPRLYVYHSAETEVQRSIVTDAVRKKPYVVLGTRSAIFLPHNNLGLVVVDEEHDGAYKQDSSPRYNGRDCAAVLASLHGARFLVGSATPSLETIFNCNTGKYARISITERYYGSAAAKVEIIDTTAEFRKNGMVGNFSRKLIAQIGKTLSGGGQVLILRARRAYSTSMQCTQCGEIVKCPRCNVPMSFHKDSGKLVCHYCGARKPSDACPSCGGELRGIGSGTQKIEEETARLFPSARVARLDGDTPGTARQEITESFGKGEIDILIGTQMLVKGFDFPGLKLVAAIGADSLIGLMDFRADEKAVQVLSQLRGRAGRREDAGMLMIQTSQSAHPVYRLLSGLASAVDFENELNAQRQAFGYPPFTRMIDLILQDSFDRRLDYLSLQLASRLKEAATGSVLGPFPPQIDKIAGKFIRIIRITLPRDGRLMAAKHTLRTLVSDFESFHKWSGHIAIDVDPL